MSLDFEDYITSENITKEIKSRIRKFAPLAEQFFAEKNLSPTVDNLMAFQETLIAEGQTKNYVRNGVSALRKYYTWKSEKENDKISKNNISDNISNNMAEYNISKNNIEKTEMKKISVNISRLKYLQLQCIALKHDKNFSDFISMAIDNLLKEYESELANITGIF